MGKKGAFQIISHLPQGKGKHSAVVQLSPMDSSLFFLGR